MFLATNGGHDWRHDRVEGRDWARWAYSGWLCYYASQFYVTDPVTFRKKLAVTMRDIGPYTSVYAGIAFAWSESKNTVNELIQPVYAAREMGTGDVMLFHGTAFTPELLDALRQKPFQHAAVLPPTAP